MADKRISALPSASTPLAGTEVLPIVQGGDTVNVSVANLTDGRAVAMAGGSFTDNIVQGTAAKGINFTANTPAAGMTSQLLNWYEQGTWTPTAVGYDGVMTVANATYIRIGNLVKASASVTYDGTVDASTVNIIGLPFAVTAAGVNGGDGGAITFCTNGTLKYADFSSTTNLRFYDTLGALVTYTTLGAANVQFVLIYSTP
jgi:hypothetical protein